MRDEIAAAVVFLTKLVKKNDTLTKEQVETFSDNLSSTLVERFKNHWYTDKPLKGQGYRCIRINENGQKDQVLEKAAKDSGLEFDDLRLPKELTLWIDPEEVCCRFGELKGSWCTIAKFKNGEARKTPNMVEIEDALCKQEFNQKMQEVTGHKVTRSNNKSEETSSALHQKNKSKSMKLNNQWNQHFSYQKQGVIGGHRGYRGKEGPSSLNIHATPFVTGGSPTQHNGPISEMDRYHWVRGADLIKV